MRACSYHRTSSNSELLSDVSHVGIHGIASDIELSSNSSLGSYPVCEQLEDLLLSSRQHPFHELITPLSSVELWEVLSKDRFRLLFRHPVKVLPHSAAPTLGVGPALNG